MAALIRYHAGYQQPRDQPAALGWETTVASWNVLLRLVWPHSSYFSRIGKDLLHQVEFHILG